jgi:hypothetical protein
MYPNSGFLSQSSFDKRLVASSCMSVRSAVCMHELPLRGFLCNFMFRIFTQICRNFLMLNFTFTIPKCFVIKFKERITTVIHSSIFTVSLWYFIAVWATCFDYYRVIFRPSRCMGLMFRLLSSHLQDLKIYGLHVSTPIESSSGHQDIWATCFDSYRVIFRPSRCMSGSTSWGSEDDSIGVETCSPKCYNIS